MSTTFPNGPADRYVAAATRYDEAVYRRAGSSGIRLPRISLGLWQNFGLDRTAASQRATVLHAFDRGITHFDLANNYGPPYGAAEARFGQLLEEELAPYRDELFVATKAGYDMWPGPYGDGGSRKYLLRSLEQSLRRLRTDYVDVFYSHRPDPETPIEETMGALAGAVASGKALYVGLSNYGPEETTRSVAALREHGIAPILHQPRYSLFDRTPEGGIFEVLGEAGIGAAVFSPLAQGLLTAKYLDGKVPADSRAAKSHYLNDESVTDAYLERIRGIQEIANGLGVAVPVLALAWVLRLPVVTTAIVGASRTQQLDDALAATELELDPATVDALERFGARTGGQLSS